jgi:serine/threonine protein kinase/Tfp pilus assembly protein PilF
MNDFESAGKISPSDERAGDRIGRYRLVKLIGEGAWGTVWIAEQAQDIERKVALKILKLGLDTKDFLARFEAERQMMAMMDHSGIAKILDAGATDFGRPYLVMELIDGMPLLTYAGENELTIRDRVALFAKICRALSHAHERGVIHRDIKPSNILITEENGEPIPKIIDFGIAKTNQFQLPDKTLFTNIHTFIGTPLYSSPEQLEFCGMQVDPRSDIYSLGTLLYQLLTGRNGFDLDSLSDQGMDRMRSTLMTQDPPRPSARFARLAKEEQERISDRRSTHPGKLHQLLRGDLDWIVMKCIEKDRQPRYESADALANDLEAYLSNRPVSAVAPSIAYRTGKFLKRNLTGLNVWMLLAGVVLCLIGLAFYFQSRISGRDSTGQIYAHDPSIEKNTVAVMPFQAQSKSGVYAFLADGFHSEMTAALSGRKALKTPSRNAVVQYRDSGLSSQALGQNLQVAHLLTGNVQEADGTLQVSVQLIETATDKNLWSKSFIRKYSEEDFLSVQGDICRAIAREVSYVIAPEDIQSPVPTQNFEALQAYLKAKEIVDRDIGSRIQEALDLFEKAIALDPQFTQAYVGLAKAYQNSNAMTDFTDVPWEAQKEKIAELAFQSMELNEHLPEVHVLAGVAKLQAQDHESAVKAFEQASEIDPRHPDAIFNLARFQVLARRSDPNFEEIMQWKLSEVGRALQLDPGNSEYHFYCASLLNGLGRTSEALEHYQAAVDHNPDSYRANNYLGLHWYREFSRFDEAIKYQRKTLSLHPHEVQFAANIRGFYYILGDQEQAIQWTAVERTINTKYAPLYDAQVHLFRGELDEAAKEFKRTYEFFNDGLNYRFGRQFLFSYDLRNGNYEEALDRYQQGAPKLFEPNAKVGSSTLDYALDIVALLLASGEPTKAEPLLNEVEQFQSNASDGAEKNFNQALFFALTGDYGSATQFLRNAVEQKFRDRIRLADARFDPLRDDPKFKEIMNIVETDMAEQLANVRRMEARGELAPIPESPQKSGR